ncbi:hypothetical protein EBZ80_07690 [bacterium]|nr:hypothetical protein [bacterium]
MAKFITFAVMLVIAALSARFAHFYFVEKRLQIVVWDVINPVATDESTREAIMSRVTAMKVEVDPSKMTFDNQDRDAQLDPSGTIQIVKRVKTVSFPWVYRRFAGEKRGVVTVFREATVKGAVAPDAGGAPASEGPEAGVVHPAIE